MSFFIIEITHISRYNPFNLLGVLHLSRRLILKVVMLLAHLI